MPFDGNTDIGYRWLQKLLSRFRFDTLLVISEDFEGLRAGSGWTFGDQRFFVKTSWKDHPR